MIQFLKKFKMSKIIIMLSSLAIIFSLIIGIFGTVATSRVNKNVDLLYDDSLLPINNINDINENVISLRLNYANAYSHFDEKYIKNINKNNNDIIKNYKEYSSSYPDKTELKYLKSFKENYDKYLDLANKGIGKAKLGENFIGNERDKLIILGENIESALKNLKNYKMNEAKIDEKNSEEIFHSNKNILVIILILCITVFSVLTIFTIKILKGYLNEMNKYMVKISKGDLNFTIEKNGDNEFEVMKCYLKDGVNKLSNILKNLKIKSKLIDQSAENLSAISEEMASSSDNVSLAITDVAKGTSTQAEDLVEISSILNNFGESIQDMVENINSINSISKTVGNTANLSNSKMKQLTKSVGYVSQSFKDFMDKIKSLGITINKVSEITELINNIAEQTNLLALNAAIESARAGDAGKGFAVVAEEIRKLAEQSKNFSNDINELIVKVSKETTNIIQSTNEIDKELIDSNLVISDSISSFKNIVDSIGDIVPKINTLTVHSDNINNEKDNIFEKIEMASSVAEEVSASSEEISASSEEMNESSKEVAKTSNELSNLTKDMERNINEFNI